MTNITSRIGRLVKNIFLYLLGIGVLVSCEPKTQPQQPVELVQISTIDALMQGNYDGVASLAYLSETGNFGIGTFNALDGEMVLLDGKFYQCRADGTTKRPSLKTTTPFASVTRFQQTKSIELADCTFPKLKSVFDTVMQSANLFYAIKLHGNFERVKVRSVPAQKKPYPALTEVTKDQPEFGMVQVSGTLMGFYCPAFVKGVNVPGFHLHFLSDDHDFGGHVLEFELNKGELCLAEISQFRMILPKEGSFLESDLTKDLSKELEQVEGSRKD